MILMFETIRRAIYSDFILPLFEVLMSIIVKFTFQSILCLLLWVYELQKRNSSQNTSLFSCRVNETKQEILIKSQLRWKFKLIHAEIAYYMYCAEMKRIADSKESNVFSIWNIVEPM